MLYMLIKNYLIKNYLCTYTIDKNKGHYTYSLMTNFISELDNLGMGLGMLLEHGAGHSTPSIASMLLLLKRLATASKSLTYVLAPSQYSNFKVEVSSDSLEYKQQLHFGPPW
jgi:hypothetical protein